MSESKKDFNLGDATFSKIDVNSDAGLGGTSDEVFGELVTKNIFIFKCWAKRMNCYLTPKPALNL